MRFPSRAAVVAALMLSLGGCADFGCDDRVFYGVEVLVDEPGGPYSDPVEVRYRVDGGLWQEITDTESPDILDVIGYCPERARCLLGPELPGLYEVEVRRGRASAMFEVDVPSSTCHVVTRAVPVSLPAT
ncbi:MAG TPA: hypothetical protein ENK57_20010 [Polyangiaceae bacterium]|nr:hypothetical protein [Polyangiaceae bacterium]